MTSRIAAQAVLRVRRKPVPSVPEIRLELADEAIGLWDSGGGQYRSADPPPFWAFPWAGGVGLARFLLDQPDVVRGLPVLDIGAGSGIVAIAAAMAGAAQVTAVDVAADAVSAIARNAAANDVAVRGECRDPLAGTPHDVAVIMAGDVFYSATMAHRLMRYFRRAQAAVPDVRIIVGDPNRGYLTPDRFRRLAEYEVPARRALEDTDHMRATIWELGPAPPRAGTPAAAEPVAP